MGRRIKTGSKGRESAFRRWLCEELRRRGCVAYPVDTEARSGEPDLVGLLPDGRFFAIEAKKKGGRLSRLQDHNIRKILDRNGIGAVIPGRDEAREFFLRIGLPKPLVRPRRLLRQAAPPDKHSSS